MTLTIELPTTEEAVIFEGPGCGCGRSVLCACGVNMCRQQVAWRHTPRPTPRSRPPGFISVRRRSPSRVPGVFVEAYFVSCLFRVTLSWFLWITHCCCCWLFTALLAMVSWLYCPNITCEYILVLVVSWLLISSCVGVTRRPDNSANFPNKYRSLLAITVLFNCDCDIWVSYWLHCTC